MGMAAGLGEVRNRVIGGALRAGPGQLPWEALLHDLGNVGEHARPVVIQGGLSSRREYYEPLKRLLLNRGFDATVTKLPAHGFASLADDAAKLQQLVEEASVRSRLAGGDGLVTLLGHSKGGLTSRWYLQRMGGIERAAQLVTLGTPHNGSLPFGPRLTALAGRLPTLPGVSDLSGNGPVVRALNDELPAFMARATELHPEFRMVSVAGDITRTGQGGTDGLVSLGAARLDPSIPNTHNVVVRDPGANHGAIAGTGGFHEPTIRATARLIAGADASSGAALLA